MNCANHSEVAAVAFCRTCGKPLCAECMRPAQGTVYCEEHAAEGVAAAGTAAAASGSPGPAQPRPMRPAVDLGASPGLAFLLGLIPGVGAIYNGQYAKGLVHAIVFGLLVSIVSSDSAGRLTPLFGILIAVWIFYMALEAYHTANKRRLGERVEEFSSLVDVRGSSRFPVGAILLIGLGILLLLDTTDVIPFERLARYWPVLLIVLGLYMLWARLTPGGVEGSREVRDDRR